MLTFNNNLGYAHQLEWIMRVTYSGQPISASLYLYQNQQQIRSCSVPNIYTYINEDKSGNFGCDVYALYSGEGSNGNNISWDIIYPGTYFLRIVSGTTDKYFEITIPEYQSFNPPIDPQIETDENADFYMLVEIYSSTVQFIANARGSSVSSSILNNWINHTVTLKNSFNSDGIMNVDGNTESIPASGKVYTWPNLFFPHNLGAIDQKPATLNYWQRFQNWSTGSTNSTISIPAGSGTYQANFSNEYNVTFQNSFSGASGGIISVNGQQVNAPYNTTALQNIGVNAIAVYNNINGISYSFTQWNDGITTSNRHFDPTDHTTYTAFYVGRPNNQFRNLHFSASDPNAPITVLWNEHPNTNVTQYQVWRKSKYKKQATSQPILLGTVNRGTTSFVDYDFAGTTSGFTDWILWYDVKAYFQPDNTYSLDDYVQVFSDGLLPKISGNNSDIITENKIDNYPNPFNPTTAISYQLVNSGYVSIKIYDIIGNEIAVIVDEVKSKGKHQIYFNAGELSSGIYIYRIVTAGYTESKKMILSK
jgi:hypothetical protein